jgi:hypothetical protein
MSAVATMEVRTTIVDGVGPRRIADYGTGAPCRLTVRTAMATM